MKNLTLLILDTETDYAARLAAYIGSREDSPFLVRLFLGHPCPADALAQADVLLLTSSLWTLYRELLPSCPVLVLDEDGSRVEGAQSVIFKYQSAARLFEALQRCFLDYSGRSLSPDGPIARPFLLVPVYTPSCAPLVSSALLSMIRERAARQAVLYLNMEQVPSRGPLSSGSGESLSSLIYYIKQYPDTIGDRLSMMTGSDGFDYLPPADFPGELLELDASDWKQLAEGLRRDSSYEEVFLDFGGSLPPPDLLPHCDEILVLRSSAVWEEEMAGRFCDLLAHAAGPEIRDRIRVQICR